MQLLLGSNRIAFRDHIDALATIPSLLSGALADRFLLVSDETVFALHGARISERLAVHGPVSKLIIPPGERMKNFATLGRLCEEAVAAGATRRTVVVALGGGVVGNISGLLATLLFRGVRLVHIPTTLLAAADSVISLKSAINSVRGKNVFGSYIAPTAIVIDTDCFATLPEVERMSGLAELVKNVLTVTPKHRDELKTLSLAPQPWSRENWLCLIKLGMQAKLDVMRDDPHEKGPALVFEYGHTVGHALELADLERRGSNSIRHGLAVAIGLHAAALVAEDMGLAATGLAAAHCDLLTKLSLPTRLPQGLAASRIRELVLLDNKRGRLVTAADKVPMVLLRGDGILAGSPALPLVSVPISVIERALVRLAETPQAETGCPSELTANTTSVDERAPPS